jgi:hypothetical protein
MAPDSAPPHFRREATTIEEAAHGRVNTVTETATVEGPWVVEERLEYLRTRP